MLPNELIFRVMEELETWWNFAQLALTCRHLSELAKDCRSLIMKRQGRSPFRQQARLIDLSNLSNHRLDDSVESIIETLKELSQWPLQHGDLIDTEGFRDFGLGMWSVRQKRFIASAEHLGSGSPEELDDYFAPLEMWEVIWYCGIEWLRDTDFYFVAIPKPLPIQVVVLQNDLHDVLLPLETKIEVSQAKGDEFSLHTHDQFSHVKILLWVEGVFLGHHHAEFYPKHQPS